MENTTIRFYGTNWCGDCRRAKAVFAELQVPYVWVDVDQSPQAGEFVKQVNRGLRRVPTLVFPDGSILVEPDDDTLRTKLSSFQSNEG